METKLCKRCKYSEYPMYLYNSTIAMCGHPEAERSVVDGKLEQSCQSMRVPVIGLDKAKCGIDAKLFEPLPEPPPPRPFVWVPEAPPPEPDPDLKIGWWSRIFGIFGG